MNRQPRVERSGATAAPVDESRSEAREHLRAEIRDRLLQRRATLHSRIGELHEIRAGAASDADALRKEQDSELGVELELTDTLEEQFRGALSDVEAALDRIDDDRFGRCTSCGLPIPVERLHILPQTQHCIHCRPRASGERS